MVARGLAAAVDDDGGEGGGRAAVLPWRRRGEPAVVASARACWRRDGYIFAWYGGEVVDCWVQPAPEVPEAGGELAFVETFVVADWVAGLGGGVPTEAVVAEAVSRVEP